MDCGCADRAEILGGGDAQKGYDLFWTGVTIAIPAAILLLTKGGAVTRTTKNVLLTGLGGAIIAIFADKIVKPVTK